MHLPCTIVLLIRTEVEVTKIAETWDKWKKNNKSNNNNNRNNGLDTVTVIVLQKYFTELKVSSKNRANSDMEYIFFSSQNETKIVEKKRNERDKKKTKKSPTNGECHRIENELFFYF